jgi:ATP:ADP antiporter, AAA family
MEKTPQKSDSSSSSLTENSSFKTKTNKFSEALSRFWPIYSNEYRKFFSIAALMFCILFIQNVIRATKDSVVNTMIGPESVSFLKVWGVMPAAIFYAAIYVKLVNTFKPESLFYLVISTFMAFFAFFGFVIFPFSEYFHMSDEYSSHLILMFPNFKWFILLAAKWGFSLFYIIAEIWPNAAYAVLFWQFINGITNVDESKRFYPMFALFGQTGLFFSGTLLVEQSKIGAYLYNSGIGGSSTIASVGFVMSVVIMLGLIAMFIFKYININVLHVRANDLIEFRADKKKKMSISESFRFAAKSRYIVLIAIMLTCYGLSINLVEGPWKKIVAKVYSSTEDNLAFVGGYLRMTGLLTLVFVLLGSNIVRFLGWYAAAIATPIIMFVTGLIFFLTLNYTALEFLGIFSWIMYDPMLLAVSAGQIQNVVTKSTKYTIFDSTKEMAYVPLDEELKVRGKAAVDSIGIKLGKSASAFIQSLIFIIFPLATYESIAPFLMVVFTIVCILWFWSVSSLSKEYENLANKNS